MYEVVICTVSTGRIQRVRFNDSDAAWACADRWNERNKSRRTYLVTVSTVTSAPAKQIDTGRTISM